MGSRRKNRLSYKGSKEKHCVICQQRGITKPQRSFHDVLACLRPFQDKHQERLVTLSIDSGGRLIRRRVVTIGLLDVSLVHSHEVFAGPLADRATRIVICHNRSSGIVSPSAEDKKTTQQLIKAGELLGIPIQDTLLLRQQGI